MINLAKDPKGQSVFDDSSIVDKKLNTASMRTSHEYYLMNIITAELTDMLMSLCLCCSISSSTVCRSEGTH